MIIGVTEKPWGKEEIWLSTDEYVVKLLHIKEGHRISLQYHEKKSETWLILQGEGAYTLDSSVFNYKPGTVVAIPAEALHRAFAGKGNTVILETSMPELDDVIRIEDDYERDVADSSPRRDS